MNRSWVRFPQAAQKRPPLQGWALSSMYEARAECAGERAVGLGVPSCGARGCGCPGWALHPATIAAGLLGVPVGGGPPARRPRRELRSARRLVVRPGPDAAHGHRSLALRQPAHWCWWGFSGYRTLRVAGGVTFRCAGVEKWLFAFKGVGGVGVGRSGPECRWWRGRRAHPAASRAQVRMEGCGGEWFGVPVPRLFLFVGALHPIRRQCTSSVRVHRHVTGAPPRNGCSAPVLVAVVAAVGVAGVFCA